MLNYKAPLRDLRFVYYELFGAEELAKLPGFEEATPDLVMDVVAEMARFSEDVLVPLNPIGDAEGCHFEGGKVRMPAGFVDAYKTYREGGWVGLTARPTYGGQGLPHAVSIMITEIMCAANLSFSMVTALSNGAYNALDHHATDALKERFLGKLVEGTWAATMCLTEP